MPKFVRRCADVTSGISRLTETLGDHTEHHERVFCIPGVLLNQKLLGFPEKLPFTVSRIDDVADSLLDLQLVRLSEPLRARAPRIVLDLDPCRLLAACITRV